MIDLEQLRKDMEAGTQGDAWVIGDRGASIYVEGDGKPYRYAERVGGAVHDYDGGSDLEFSEADLRRITRVPQLERIALAAELFTDIVDDFCQISDGSSQRLIDALAAYREATK